MPSSRFIINTGQKSVVDFKKASLPALIAIL